MHSKRRVSVRRPKPAPSKLRARTARRVRQADQLYLTTGKLLILRKKSSIPAEQVSITGPDVVKIGDLRKGDAVECNFYFTTTYSRTVLGVFVGKGMMEITHEKPSQTSNLYIPCRVATKTVDITGSSTSLLKKVQLRPDFVGTTPRKRAALK